MSFTTQVKNQNEAEITSAHLFSGGGGDTDGAVRAGCKPLWAIESDRYSAAVYRYQFPKCRLIETDIRTLSNEFIQQLPKPSLLVGGSPCPDFSISGKRTGLQGERGSLFFEFIRMLRILRPKAFAFENVKGVLACNNGQDFRQIIQAFNDLGYLCEWQMRNGKHHVPQNRERVFVVGRLS